MREKAFSLHPLGGMRYIARRNRSRAMPSHSHDWTRRRFLSAAASAAALSACSSPDEASGAPPNILFLLTDDQRWDTLGVTGNRVIETPHIDRLAHRGTLFDNCFVTTSICAVSRASFFTGLYARSHGVHDFRTPFTEELHAYSYPARVREEAGYRTGFIGKYGVGDAAHVEAAGARFDYFEGFPGQGQYFVEGRAHMTEHIGNQAVEFLDGCSSDQPWNLSISFKAPHVQDGVPPYFLSDPKYDHMFADAAIEPFPHMDPAYFDSLPEFLRDTENRVRWEQRFPTPDTWEESVKRYYRLIYGIDVQVGRIMGELERRGMLGNTVVIFTGDNGFYLGERGFAGKWFMHEESIRVPLIVSDPRQPATHGSRRSEMALNIDVSPTILSLAGLDIPQSIQGRDLTPLVAGANPEWRSEWFYEHLFERHNIPKSEGVRTERQKYFQYIESDPLHEELYDLERDPLEAVNLAGDPEHAGTLERMRQRWEAWLDSLTNWRIDQAWSEPS